MDWLACILVLEQTLHPISQLDHQERGMGLHQGINLYSSLTGKLSELGKLLAQ